MGENYLQNLKLAELIQLGLLKKNICTYFNILKKLAGFCQIGPNIID